jgi:hypothetical protein
VDDRRGRPRFEIVGQLRGSLVVFENLRLHNISPGGALLEADRSVPMDSVYEFRFEINHQPTRVSARVRHVRPTDGRYLLGIEFVAPGWYFVEQIRSLVAAGPV